MSNTGNQGAPTDPEAGWPPRFNDLFIAIAGFLLLAVAVAAALILRDVIAPSTPAPTMKQTMAYVFAVAGLLMLLLGALFGLVEAKRAPKVLASPRADDDVESGRAFLLQVDGKEFAETIGKVSGVISKEKRSTAAWSIGVGLLLLAGAASGLVSLSVGDDATGDNAGDQTGEAGQDDAGDDGEA